MQADLALLNKLNNKEYSLNLQKFKEERKQLQATNKDLDTLSKLSKNLAVKNIAADTLSINSAKEKVEKNTQWIKRLSNDIYIDETVKVLDNMIIQSATAKNN